MITTVNTTCKMSDVSRCMPCHIVSMHCIRNYVHACILTRGEDNEFGVEFV